jgi:hypothetical protein
MKGFLLFTGIVLMLFACNKSLNQEQREEIRENMKKGEIRKVTEAELLEAAYGYARPLATTLETLSDNPVKIDSLCSARGIVFVPLSSSSALTNIEAQILEAYQNNQGEKLSDNMQKIGTDSLLYTRPIQLERPDGSYEFMKAIGIRMSRKQVVLSMGDE